MDVVSLCPLRAFGFVWQSSSGAHAQTVVIKATFVLEPGRLKLAAEQDALREQDESVKGEAALGLFFPSDRVPYKPRVDVMLVGHAYAPAKQPVRSLTTRLSIGEVNKCIEVWCDRGFRSAGERLLEGPRFTKMPLDWSRAAGGAGTTNPAGMSLDAAPDAYGLVPIPNLQPQKTLVVKRSDPIAPIGYGPIAPSWPERTRALGRLSGKFPEPGWEDKPLPEELDPAFFQAAPRDQQIAVLHPDESLVLEHLHPTQPHLVTRLPGLVPRAVVDRVSGEREEVRLVADTLWIDTDRGIAVVVWRGSIGLRHAAEGGRISVSFDEPEPEALDENLLVTIPPGVVDDDELAAMTMNASFDAKPKGPAIPFLGAEHPARPPAQARNDDGALPFGAGGVSGPPPGPIAIGQVTLPPTIVPSSSTAQSGWASSGPATTRDAMVAGPEREPLQLLWYEPESIAGMRRMAGWKSVFEERRSRDMEVVHGAQEPWDVEARQEVLAILGEAPRTDARGLDEAFEGARGRRGEFVPPMVLLAGELELPFDELEALKAAMSTAVPVIAPGDEELNVAVAVAKDFVQTPGLSAAPAVSEGLTLRIREAFVREKKSLPSDYVDTQMERVLLVGRHYQRREVFGGMFVRCLMWLSGERVGIVGYLPAEAAKKLPMWRRFRARVIAEVHPAQGQYEGSGRALRVVAVGRVG